MWKRLGMTVVACGVMLGVAGFADAGVVSARTTHRTTAQRTAVKPHKKVVKHDSHKTIQHRRHAAVQTPLQNAVARRWSRGMHRHSYTRGWHRMV